MNYWLFKSEPKYYSIDDLEQDSSTEWDGVRNYQARNFMRDQMKVGDLGLFYHSNAKPPGVVGICRVCREAHADHTAWDPEEDHYDPKASEENPIWQMVDVEFVEKFPQIISLDALKKPEELEGLMVTQKGSRLSIQPVSGDHFKFIRRLGNGRE